MLNIFNGLVFFAVAIFMHLKVGTDAHEKIIIICDFFGFVQFFSFLDVEKRD